MKKVLIKILATYTKWRTKWRANRLHYKAAIRKAERKKKRAYIYFLGGRYRVFTRKDIQYLKSKKVIRPQLNIEKMRGVQLYDTNGHINSHPLYYNVTVRGIDIVYKPAKPA